MNNKGFIFIETIITTVILLTTLLVLYSTFSNVVINEKARLYHDDIAFVYQTKHINEILEETVDKNKFLTNYNKARNPESGDNERYMYFFNVQSDIFYDNQTIYSAMALYEWKILAYVSFDDITNLKKCVQGKENSDICKNTIAEIDSYSTFGNAKGYLIDYLKNIDVRVNGDIKSKSSGILISLFFQAKNGDTINGDLNYDTCLNNNKNQSMKCEKAPHIAWVYETITKNEIIYGDIDNSGEVNNKDVLLLSNVIEGLENYINYPAADLNLDGNITQKDYEILQYYLLEYSNYLILPCTADYCKETN